MSGKKNFAKFMEKKMFSNAPKEKMNDEFRNIRKEENLSNIVNTSERRILFYKTKICPWYIKGKCERRKTCLYAHAQNELRELPNLCKTSLCPKLKINESCNDKKCKYAHTNIELRATENLYKTALCESFIKGKCFSGQFCRYAHGQNELREHPMEITDKNIIIGTSKMKNDKLDFEKKKISNNNCNNIQNIDNCKRNETYCVMPKKKETHLNKVSALTEDDAVGEVTEAMDPQALNDSTTDNSYDCAKKGRAENTTKHGGLSGNGNNNGGNHGANSSGNHSGNNLSRKNDVHEYHKRSHKNQKYRNSEIMNNNSSRRDGSNRNDRSSSSVGNYLKHEDCTKFNDEQFLNDSLNVLGFLEEHNNGVEKFCKGHSMSNSIINDVGNNSLSNFPNNSIIGGTNSNNNALLKYVRNNKGIGGNSSNSSSLINFNVATQNAGNLDMNVHNNSSEDNYYNFNTTNMENLNYEDIFFGGNSTNNSLNALNSLNSMNSMGSISSFNSMSCVSGMNVNTMNEMTMSNMNSMTMNMGNMGSMNNMCMDMNSENLNNMDMNSMNMNNMNINNMNVNSMNMNSMNMNSVHMNSVNMKNMKNVGCVSGGMAMTMNSNGDCGSVTEPMCKYLMLNKELKNNGVTRTDLSGNNVGLNSINMIEVVGNCEQQQDNIISNKLMKEKENSDDLVSWENFSLFGKAKSFSAEKDYFKIFNYGMCNNFDNKLFNNCDVHKNEMEKVDKSLFIL
ncbi:zinc finger protein [Plasmodium gonderi]|uniref:Zinc finger protein n=1 Tax=Plasmodium gonderi TaxID=77519 RepID=A0A1Y1JC78_PLAGO|nr:zinc finger protein [Plasmodium gonderi]GAW80131.1 zinc finger protein [Plasmodium gonderi]